MNIKNLFPYNIELDQKQKIYTFLRKYIPQGTVILPETIYDSATNWTVLYTKNNKMILGFSAQKFFDFGYFSVIQIMATFISEKVRGRHHAAILMQGQLFWKQFLQNPKKTIYWCTRTRVPTAFAASRRYNNIYPKITIPNTNFFHAEFSEFIAQKIYGNHIHFEKETYKIINSYVPESIFVALNPIRKNRNGKITNYFIDNIDFNKNEAIFIISKISRILILKYFIIKIFEQISLLKWIMR